MLRSRALVYYKLIESMSICRYLEYIEAESEICISAMKNNLLRTFSNQTGYIPSHSASRARDRLLIIN